MCCQDRQGPEFRDKKSTGMQIIAASESSIQRLGSLTVRRRLFPPIEGQLDLCLCRLHFNRGGWAHEATGPDHRDPHRPIRTKFHRTASNRTSCGLSMNTVLPCSAVDKTEGEMLNEEKMRKCFF